MDIGNENHQQFFNDFILSLHTGGDDGNPCMQSGSRSLSESSLNPNAAEFVPSYMKISDIDYDENDQQLQQQKHQLQCQRMASKNLNSSSTTLVDGIIEGTATRKESEGDKMIFIQRRLCKLMNHLGSQNLPLQQIQFSLTTDGNGVSVQFLSPESSKQLSLDKDLCQRACFRVNMDEHGLQSIGPEFALGRQFLDRMGDFISNNKMQVNSLVVCPKCTGLGPKKPSYTELEIDRQIEDIKAFERLINEDEGARYQDAFKQLCLKLGITQSSEQPATLKTLSDPALRTVKQKPTSEEIELPRTEDNLSSYEWDPFIPELTTTRPAYKQLAPDSSVRRQASEQKQRQASVHFKEGCKKQNLHPPVAQGTTCPTPGAPSTGPLKPLKPLQTRLSNTQPSRVASNMLKEKPSKIHQLRYSLPPAVAATARLAVVATATATATAAAANTATRAAVAVGVACKKPQEQAHLNGSRIKRLSPRKSELKEIAARAIRKPSPVCKLEPRSTLAKPKSQLEHVHVNKATKAATLPRAGGVSQTQENKQQSSTATQRVVLPRSTHASQMRQTEVKRRLNLMRGDDTDVQINEYLFK